MFPRLRKITRVNCTNPGMTTGYGVQPVLRKLSRKRHDVFKACIWQIITFSFLLLLWHSSFIFIMLATERWNQAATRTDWYLRQSSMVFPGCNRMSTYGFKYKRRQTGDAIPFK